MKKSYKLIVSTLVLSTSIAFSCSDDFLNRAPLGAISEEAIANEKGVDGSLIVAYRAMQGNQIAAWYTSPNNWLWGGIRSDDAYKGSEALDQATEINPVERFEVLPSSPSVSNKWRAIFDGIGMANIVIRQAEKAADMILSGN